MKIGDCNQGAAARRPPAQSDGSDNLAATVAADLYVKGISLEPVLVVQGSAFPIAFGSGTPGVWPLGEFLSPIPGMTPIELPSGPYMPSPPIYSSGVRFTAAWVVPDGWESVLLAGDGEVRLQIHGTVSLGGSPLQDPLFTATLMPVPEPSTWALGAAGGLLVWMYGRARRMAYKITGRSAGGPRQLPIRTSLTARVGELDVGQEYEANPSAILLR